MKTTLLKIGIVLYLMCPLYVCSTVQASDHDDIKNPVIGYEYNLWGIQADRISGKKVLEYTGRIFLDTRKEFKSGYNEDEHWFFNKEVLKDGELIKIHGSNKASVDLLHNKTKDYYVTLKVGNNWNRFYYEDILNEENTIVGQEVGCKQCNFAEQIYLPEHDWYLTLYFEIKPHYKFEKTEAELNAPIANKEPEKLKMIEYTGEAMSPQKNSSSNTQSEVLNEVTAPRSSEEQEIKLVVEQREARTKDIATATTAKSDKVIVAHRRDDQQISTISSHNKQKAKDVVKKVERPKIVQTNTRKSQPQIRSMVDKHPYAPIPSVPVVDEKSYHVLFKITASAYEEFTDLQHLGTLQRETYKESGKTKYLIGNTKTIEEAREIVKEIQKLGYKNLFIAEYQNGVLQEYVERIQS